jgi:hypothetical protein
MAQSHLHLAQTRNNISLFHKSSLMKIIYKGDEKLKLSKSKNYKAEIA